MAFHKTAPAPSKATTMKRLASLGPGGRAAAASPTESIAAAAVDRPRPPPGADVPTLADDLRAALSRASRPGAFALAGLLDEALDRTSVDDGDDKPGEPLLSERLRPLADRIDAASIELARDASVLADEFEALSSSNATFDVDGGVGFDNVVNDATTLDGSLERRDEPRSRPSDDASSHAQLEQSWLRDLEAEASTVASWEAEAEKLAALALVAFRASKDDAASLAADVARDAEAEWEGRAELLRREATSIRDGRSRSYQEENRADVDPILLREETWTSSGGVRERRSIPSEEALDAIRSTELATYALKGDGARDVGAGEGRRRTRRHVGVVPGGGRSVAEGATADPASIFSYNVGALAELATSLDRLRSKVTSADSFLRDQGGRSPSSLEEKLSSLKARTERAREEEGDDDEGGSYRSPLQRASDVAALETEAALSRVDRLARSVVHSVRVNSLRAKYASRSEAEATRDRSAERTARLEGRSAQAREERAGACLEGSLAYLGAIDAMTAAWNETKRELLEMEEEATIESRVAREEIRAEASVERDDESASLKRIRLLGKARMEEVVAAIENVFRRLAGCLRHLATSEGREQFFLYVGAAAVLVFACSTSKELITLGCACALRLFTAPRLVREYGNSRFWGRRSGGRCRADNGMILPPKTKERIDMIAKVAAAAGERGYPLRSVLLTGPAGCGKTSVAREIASSIPNLPYALMCGADVFPMGSQGPAELRRLLTWAKSRRRGGIVIIDEAESALKSREIAFSGDKESGSETESEGYSRDCLNVLLSMTGTFGNIMLILATSNPSALDEAVLDRMDEIVHLPLPSAEHRRMLLRSQFARHFEPKGKELRPFADRLLSKMRVPTTTKASFDVDFDVERCVSDLAADSKTYGFSIRELEKLIQGVLYKTFASDDGHLSTALWEKETSAMIDAFVTKHRLKSK